METLSDWRKDTTTIIERGNIIISFHQLEKAETMIIVTIKYEIGKGTESRLKTTAKTTAVVSCFEAYDIYKSLKGESHDKGI